MASRRFIQRFDRLNANAQRHLEAVVELLHEMGYTQDHAGPVLVFPTAGPDALPLFDTSPAERRRRQIQIESAFGNMRYERRLSPTASKR